MPGKISEMPAAATLTGTEPFETVQGGATKAGTINQIRDYSSLSPLIVNSVGAGSDSEIRLAINGAGKAAFYCVAASNLTWLYSRAMSAVNGIWYHATGGLAWGSPTGGDKGAGTINAQAVYDDNALLSCYVLEAFLDGSIDVGAWDARVPDRETPETRITESVRVTTEAVVLEPAPEGFVAVVRNVERDATEPQPVFDEAGNRLGEVEVPITREVVTPASVEERRHEPARRFAESRMDEQIGRAHV